jgi:hypothetical protein
MRNFLLFALFTLLAPIVASAENIPVSPNGISLYTDYMNWKLIAPSYREDKGHIRIITGNDIAHTALREGRLPLSDGSALAKVAWNSVKNSSFPIATEPGEFAQVEFMVKDCRKYKSTGGWGFARFVGSKLTPYGKNAGFVNECFGCHVPVAKNDCLQNL